MRGLRLKFPDRGQEAKGAGYAFMLLGIFALAGVLYQFKSAMDEVAYWELRIDSLDRRTQRKTTSQVSSQVSPSKGGGGGGGSRDMKQEVKRADTVMSEIDLPWGPLFDSIEYATSPDVALLSFQPDAAGRIMRIGGEAKSMPVLLDFISALEREPVLKDAHLLKYEIKQDDPLRPIIFSVTASWIETS